MFVRHILYCVTKTNVRLVNNNKWGDDGTGFSCMNILDQGQDFSITYQWRGPSDTVKAFPYMKLDPARLPVQLWNASTLQFKANWSTIVEGYGDDAQSQTTAYDNTALKANAAIDMFLSDDATNSTGLGCPIEIMIWLWYPPTMLPLGSTESTPQIDTVEVSGMHFSLYHGWNAQGQHVFSWLAHQNMTSADDDFAPLLSYIWQKGLLSGALYLGQIEFGTEVMHAGETTTFTANNYELALYREGDKDDPNPKTTSTTSTSSSATPMSTSSAQTSSSATSAASPSSSSSGAGSVVTAELSLQQKLCILLPLLVFASTTLLQLINVHL